MHLLRTLFLSSILITLVAPLPVQAAPRCFPEAPGITDCIDGRIRQFWEAQGGLPVFGYPIGPQSAVNGIQTQLFERARLELHPENTAPYDILLGRLGADRLATQGRDLASFPQSAQQAGCLFFAQTGHNICPPFLTTWRRYGLDLGDPGVSERESLALWGLPLDDPQSEEVAPGVMLPVQWFERARFEDHGAQGVLLGLLGRELGDTQAQSSPASASGEQSPAGGFITVQGNRLARNGQPIVIKGVNYYPQGVPWADMWENWYGSQIEAELRAAHTDLGINAVRVLVPYDLGTWRIGRDRINPRQLNRLRELVQFAGKLDMRVIIALFDFDQDFPKPGTGDEEEQRAFVRQIVAPFANDERVMAWDIHNEPENYDLWKTPVGADQVQVWLGRMADLLHEVAPRQLVTVGVANYDSVWRVGPDGRRILDYSDVISFHSYNAADVERQLYEIRTRTDKPVLLQEFGWPTGPTCSQQGYDEATQAAAYQQFINDSGAAAGIMQWTLRDYDAGPTMRFDTREEHYGLYRPDGSLKPAAEPFRSYDAPALPSATQTDLPVTSEGRNPIDGPLAPVLTPSDQPGKSYYLKHYFRFAYNLLGAQGSFGVPISEAYWSPQQNRFVQYFSAGLLAYYPEATKEPNFNLLDDIGKAQLLIRPLPVGLMLTDEAGFPTVDRPPSSEADYFPTTHHSLRGAFRSFYKATYGPWRLGAPISEELVEQVNGVDTRVQYFERGRLEWDATNNVVRVGALGRAAWDIQCQSVGQSN